MNETGSIPYFKKPRPGELNHTVLTPLTQLGMTQVSQTAFFPVPVEWFNLPVPTARWGFSGMSAYSKAIVTPHEQSGNEGTSSPGTTAVQSAEPGPSESSYVGRILNEFA